MKIVYLGSGEFGIPCLEAMGGSDHELSLIVTQPPRPGGRGRKVHPTAVAEWAATRFVPRVEAPSVNAPEIVERIAECRPDVIVVIAFGQKVGKVLTELPPKGAINVHASVLPKYRGAAPVNWAIVRGETHTGVSIITLAEKIDAGDILATVATPIEPHESAGQLHDRLARLSADLLMDTLAVLDSGTATYTPQDDAEATFAPKLSKTDGFLDFAEPADAIACKVRGLWPWPGASAEYVSTHEGKPVRVVLAMAEVAGRTNRNDLEPGTLDEDLNVVCGQGRLKIVEIKPAGSRLMGFADFVNGWHVRPGDRLTRVES